MGLVGVSYNPTYRGGNEVISPPDSALPYQQPTCQRQRDLSPERERGSCESTTTIVLYSIHGTRKYINWTTNWSHKKPTHSWIGKYSICKHPMHPSWVMGGVYQYILCFPRVLDLHGCYAGLATLSLGSPSACNTGISEYRSILVNHGPEATKKTTNYNQQHQRPTTNQRTTNERVWNVVDFLYNVVDCFKTGYDTHLQQSSTTNKQPNNQTTNQQATTTPQHNHQSTPSPQWLFDFPSFFFVAPLHPSHRRSAATSTAPYGPNQKPRVFRDSGFSRGIWVLNQK